MFTRDVLYDSINNINQIGGQNNFLKLLAEYTYDEIKAQLVVDANSGNVQISNINKKLCPIYMLDNNLNWNHLLFNKIIIEKYADDILEFLNSAFNLNIIKFAVLDNEIYVDNGFPKMIPIRYLGDGIVKIIGILAVIISSRDGICLIDEIENGIYYKNQPKLIKYLDEISKKFNVQLFITTHSNDFIRNLDGFSELSLYRLNPKFDGGVMRWDREKVMQYIDDKSADIR
jgi:AAA15 family ATPase/GTPase